MAYLDKHSTLDLVMVSVVSSIPSGLRHFLLKFLKPIDVNSGLKCKCDLIVKNSFGFLYQTISMHGHLMASHTNRSNEPISFVKSEWMQDAANMMTR